MAKSCLIFPRQETTSQMQPPSHKGGLFKSPIEAHQNSTVNQICNWSCLHLLNMLYEILHMVTSVASLSIQLFYFNLLLLMVWSWVGSRPSVLAELTCAAFWCGLIRGFYPSAICRRGIVVGCVRPSVRLSVCLSVLPSVRLSLCPSVGQSLSMR